MPTQLLIKMASEDEALRDGREELTLMVRECVRDDWGGSRGARSNTPFVNREKEKLQEALT